jgi:5-formyltetrahydrofolate cyclo-ligase
MTVVHHRKALLRSDLRQRRNALSSNQQRASALELVHSVTELSSWDSAQRIALYQAADGEIDTCALEQLARKLGKQLFLPVLADDRLCFAQWETSVRLSPNRYNIPEPPQEAARCEPSDLDIIFLPLVGWDRRGSRLGMGGGFYDRTLSGVSGPLLVGLAHEVQQVEEVPQDPWDITLDYIATDAALYARGSD